MNASLPPDSLERLKYTPACHCLTHLSTKVYPTAPDNGNHGHQKLTLLCLIVGPVATPYHPHTHTLLKFD